MNQADMISVGFVASFHGVKGELRVKVLTDFPERFSPGEKLCLGKEEGPFAEVIVEASRWHKDSMLVKLKGIDDRTKAEFYRGFFFWIDRQDVKPLPSGSFYIFDLEGLRALDLERNEIGILTEIIHTPAYDAYVIKGETELIVPAFKKFVKDIDLKNRTISINLESLRVED